MKTDMPTKTSSSALPHFNNDYYEESPVLQHLSKRLRNELDKFYKLCQDNNFGHVVTNLECLVQRANVHFLATDAFFELVHDVVKRMTNQPSACTYYATELTAKLRKHQDPDAVRKHLTLDDTLGGKPGVKKQEMKKTSTSAPITATISAPPTTPKTIPKAVISSTSVNTPPVKRIYFKRAPVPKVDAPIEILSDDEDTNTNGTSKSKDDSVTASEMDRKVEEEAHKEVGETSTAKSNPNHGDSSSNSAVPPAASKQPTSVEKHISEISSDAGSLPNTNNADNKKEQAASKSENSKVKADKTRHIDVSLIASSADNKNEETGTVKDKILPGKVLDVVVTRMPESELSSLKTDIVTEKGGDKSSENVAFSSDNERQRRSASESGDEGTSYTLDPKERRRQKNLQKLYDVLRKTQQKIEDVGEQEETSDEEVESIYVYKDRLEKHALRIWRRICDQEQRAPRTGRIVEKKLKLKDFEDPELGKAVCDFVNKSRVFPDYGDIQQIVSDNVPKTMSSDEKNSLAQRVFLKVGNALKKRRIRDDREQFLSYFEDNKVTPHPADEDPQLREIFAQNAAQAKEKLDTIFGEYAAKQMTLKLEPVEVGDGEKSEGEEDEEEEEEEGESEGDRKSEKGEGYEHLLPPVYSSSDSDDDDDDEEDSEVVVLADDDSSCKKVEDETKLEGETSKDETSTNVVVEEEKQTAAETSPAVSNGSEMNKSSSKRDVLAESDVICLSSDDEEEPVSKKTKRDDVS